MCKCAVVIVVLCSLLLLLVIQASEPKKKEEKDRLDEEAQMRDAAVRSLLDLYEVVMRDFIVDPNLRCVCSFHILKEGTHRFDVSSL